MLLTSNGGDICFFVEKQFLFNLVFDSVFPMKADLDEIPLYSTFNLGIHCQSTCLRVYQE